ncbi:MFS transporter [Runella sp. MFBS21]|uniref:MFS transporter n=1 Tax=Runella sp. MFBS21 TaxID=3034018 RepID=UPI0023F6831F|nr:MFS transporter [Runella sp. MFBS21]MDF7816681.1 MFS transporter [Runella sp. MFBS21]
MSQKSNLQHLLQVPVLVAALGYLVDMYDLFLFSVVRVTSLKDLGVAPDQLLPEGVFLLNTQLAGLLIGGVFWGILGDKKGRLSILFGSIIMYSLANIANGFVTSVNQYAFLRFIAGIGLAGELGAGITLVSEVLPKEIRGYGTTVVATMGLFGAIAANFVADWFDWRISYFVGGGMGLMLLVLRLNVFESGLFEKMKSQKVQKGNVFMLFNNWQRFSKYLLSILVGIPLWFVTGILMTFSPEFGKEIGIEEPILAGKCVMLAFTGQVFGDILSGIGSQYLRSRKKIIGIFIVLSFAFMLVYLLFPSKNATVFYVICTLLGFCNGYWTIFITIAAELFGTNLRATVATSVPNFVRGTAIILTSVFVFLRPSLGIINSALVIGTTTVAIALVSLYFLEETFTKDLNYEE